MGILTYMCCFIINGQFFFLHNPSCRMVQITRMRLLSAYPRLLAPSYSTDVHLSFSLANDSTFLATITCLSWIKSFHTRRSTLDQSNMPIVSACAEGCCHVEKVILWSALGSVWGGDGRQSRRQVLSSLVCERWISEWQWQTKSSGITEIRGVPLQSVRGAEKVLRH